MGHVNHMSSVCIAQAGINMGCVSGGSKVPLLAAGLTVELCTTGGLCLPDVLAGELCVVCVADCRKGGGLNLRGPLILLLVLRVLSAPGASLLASGVSGTG